MSYTHSNALGKYGTTPLIVATDAANGSHTTLASALAVAQANETVFLRDSVTENVTLPANVNIASWQGSSASTPSITGKITLTVASTNTISGIRLVTNGDNFLAVTGSAASIINLNNCYLDCADATGITFSSSSSSASIRVDTCVGNIATTGISLFSHSSAGTLSFVRYNESNSGSTTTNSTASAGFLNLQYSTLAHPITTSGTNTFISRESQVDCTIFNTTALTLGGSGTQVVYGGLVTGGTATAISCGSALCALHDVTVGSSNAAAIAGAGTVTYSDINFSGTSSDVTTTTQVGRVTRFGVQRSTEQPAFLAYLATTTGGVTGNNTNAILGVTVALTEVFDQGGDFNVGDGAGTQASFTAPVTGRYFLQYNLKNGSSTGATGATVSIATSNRAYFISKVITSAANQNFENSVVADMDVGDTVTYGSLLNGIGADTATIIGGVTFTYVSGNLVC